MNKLIQKLYYKSCQEELMVLKPGNHSIHSGIIGMNNKRFEFAAKVSGEIFINKKLDLGEKIYQSASKCFNQLGENYNLGIILLCAPIFEILPNRLSNFKAELKFVLRNIDEFQGDLILPLNLGVFLLIFQILVRKVKLFQDYNFLPVD